MSAMKERKGMDGVRKAPVSAWDSQPSNTPNFVQHKDVRCDIVNGHADRKEKSGRK